MDKGRGGMGSHKHGISGHSGPSPRAKLMTALDANRELDQAAALRAERRAGTPMFDSVADLFGNTPQMRSCGSKKKKKKR